MTATATDLATLSTAELNEIAAWWKTGPDATAARLILARRASAGRAPARR